MDETPLEVMKVNEQEVREEYRDEDRHRKKETEKTETQKKCHMWVVRGGEEMHPVHLYNFKWTRNKAKKEQQNWNFIMILFVIKS